MCWKICKKGEGLDSPEPAICMLIVGCTHVQAIGNNVIVLINRDTASVFYG